MEEQENFEEQYLDSLREAELVKLAEAIEDDLLEEEISQNLNGIKFTNENDFKNQSINETENIPTDNILTASSLNPNAQEFVPGSPFTRIPR